MFSVCLLTGGLVQCQVRWQVWLGEVVPRSQVWGLVGAPSPRSGGFEYVRVPPPPEKCQQKNLAKNSEMTTRGAGGTPLAVTQEDCLVDSKYFNLCYFK